jgi:hypothetical protein
MIKDKLDPYLKDTDYRLHKLINKKFKEDDIIMLLRDLNNMISTLDTLYKRLSKDLSKYITKN